MEKNKTICVVGLGYIGLPTACLLAKAGYQVIGVDIDKSKIRNLKKGILPFEETGLAELFSKAKKNIIFSSTPKPADIFIISVPTPVTKTKRANLKFVKKAARAINKVIRDKNLVVVESTVPPGTTKKIILPILKKGYPKYTIYLSHAPERAIPGKTLREMTGNDRIIGGINKTSAKLTKAIYASFCRGNLFLTSASTAEFVKLIENVYRDINIAFANELAKVCDNIKIDVWEAIRLANLHPRVNILSPGPGVGGHCISVDPWFMVRKGIDGTKVIRLARRINDLMPSYVINKIANIVKGVQRPIVTLLGVSYKANVSDWRNSPALKIIELAQKRNWQIKIHDPLVKNFPYNVEKDIQKASQDSDCLVVVADHSFYQELNPGTIDNMRHKNIFDTRNCLNLKKWQKAGFKIKILGKN